MWKQARDNKSNEDKRLEGKEETLGQRGNISTKKKREIKKMTNRRGEKGREDRRGDGGASEPDGQREGGRGRPAKDPLSQAVVGHLPPLPCHCSQGTLRPQEKRLRLLASRARAARAPASSPTSTTDGRIKTAAETGRSQQAASAFRDRVSSPDCKETLVCF